VYHVFFGSTSKFLSTFENDFYVSLLFLFNIKILCNSERHLLTFSRNTCRCTYMYCSVGYRPLPRDMTSWTLTLSMLSIFCVSRIGPTYIGIGRLVLVDHQIISSVSSSVHRHSTCISTLCCVTKVPRNLVPKCKILFTMTGGAHCNLASRRYAV
jgi:hypothetical protein